MIGDSPLGVKESISDAAKVLSRYCDAVSARVNSRPATPAELRRPPSGGGAPRRPTSSRSARARARGRTRPRPGAVHTGCAPQPCVSPMTRGAVHNCRDSVMGLANNSSIPIINALDDFAHPMQARRPRKYLRARMHAHNTHTHTHTSPPPPPPPPNHHRNGSNRLPVVSDRQQLERASHCRHRRPRRFDVRSRALDDRQ